MNQQEIQVETRDVKRNVFASWVAFVIIGIAMVIIGIVAFWINQPENVLEIKNQPIPIRTIRSEAHPEGVVILKYDYCKNADITGRLRTSFVNDKSELFLPAVEERSPKTCANGTEVPYLVPPQVVAGTYKLHFTATYQLNPLKKVVIEWDSQSFEIAK